MRKAKVLVVEDEVIVGDYVCRLLEEMGYVSVGPEICYADAIDALVREDPDLIILDIQLVGKKGGLEVAEYVAQNVNIPIIFLTSYSDPKTVAIAKRVKPSGYLTKPFSRNGLYASIEIALHSYAGSNSRSGEELLLVKDSIFIKERGAFLKIPVSQISYIKSDHVYNQLFTVEGKKYLLRGRLSDFVNQFPTCFVQIHRGVVVNVAHIDRIEEGCVVINNEVLPVSKTYKERLLSILIRF